MILTAFFQVGRVLARNISGWHKNSVSYTRLTLYVPPDTGQRMSSEGMQTSMANLPWTNNAPVSILSKRRQSETPSLQIAEREDKASKIQGHGKVHLIFYQAHRNSVNPSAPLVMTKRLQGVLERPLARTCAERLWEFLARLVNQNARPHLSPSSIGHPLRSRRHRVWRSMRGVSACQLAIGFEARLSSVRLAAPCMACSWLILLSCK